MRATQSHLPSKSWPSRARLYASVLQKTSIRYNIGMTTESSNYRNLERIVKGFANHRRLQILDLLKREPELSVEEISERLNIGYENASDHVRKLAIAGLVLKRNEGSAVRHKFTPRAESILVFCKRLQ